MAKRIFVLYLFCVFLSSSLQWTAVQRRDPNYAGEGCLSKDFGKMQLYDMKTTKDCVEVYCSEEGLQYSGCSSYIKGHGCRVIHGDPGKNYPKCCDSSICDEM